MKTDRIIRIFLVVFVLTINIGCDQISKTVVRQTVDYHERIELINDFVTLTKVENTGAFLSMGNSLPESLRLVLLIIFPLLALAYGCVILLAGTQLPKNLMVGLSFLIGGGIGNIYDRIFFGSVTDFLHIDFGLFQTGIFNLADVSILIGAFLILVHSFRQKAHIG